MNTMSLMNFLHKAKHKQPAVLPIFAAFLASRLYSIQYFRSPSNHSVGVRAIQSSATEPHFKINFGRQLTVE